MTAYVSLGRLGRLAVLPLCIALSAGGGCSRGRPAEAAVSADPQVLAQRKTWRAQQDQQMRGELSPLSRIDAIDLLDGEHQLGGELALPADALPKDLGEVRLTVERAAARVALSAQPPVRKNGELVSAATLARGDVLMVGRLRLMLTGKPPAPLLAIYDPRAPARLGYRALRYFPDDERYVVRAALARYPSPRAVQLEASRGEPKDMTALGILRFTVAGVACSMEAYLEAPGSDELFLVFRDQTSGQPDGSYGAGRFLYAALLPGDQVVLDFNQAWNPLCAYSHYFHCPLPPRSNWLAVALPVGEKSYSEP